MKKPLIQNNGLRNFYCALLALFIGLYSPGILAFQSPTVTQADSATSIQTIRLTFEHVKIGALKYKKIASPKIGLALSGGALRGLSQIGVIDELRKAGIPIDYIAGSSFGAIVGGLYAVGYSTDELEQFAIETDWTNLFIDSPERSTMFIDQKNELNRHFIAFRFEGVKPYIPQAISQGQQISTFLQTRILQAGYNPNTHFDELKTPLRIVATDMLTGKEKNFQHGDLSQAIMASIAVPLLFSPVRIDSSYYWDAGLVNNIPTDVARNMGSDVVITVNTTAPLRKIDQMEYPWEHFDQGTTIMQQSRNRQALENADFVITPDLTEFQTYDAAAIPEFIRRGREAAINVIPDIKSKLNALEKPENNSSSFVPNNIEISGNRILSDDLILSYISSKTYRVTTNHVIEEDLKRIYGTGCFQDASAQVVTKNGSATIRFILVENPKLDNINFSGVTLFSDAELKSLFNNGGLPIFCYEHAVQFINDIILKYEDEGKSLVQITEFSIDTLSNTLNITVDEGRIDKIRLIGNEKTKAHVVLRELRLKEGEIFDMNRALQGFANIYGTGLFQRVYPSFNYENGKMTLQVNLEEKKSELLRLGARYDLEQESKGFVELVDDNFAGIGIKSLLHGQYGPRDERYYYQIRADRIFKSYFTYNAEAYYSARTDYMTDQYSNFSKMGDFRDTRTGLSFSLGRQLSRFGLLSASLHIEKVKIEAMPLEEFRSPPGTGIYDKVNERRDLRRFVIRSVIDTRDQFPFPSKGYYQDIYYETSGKIFTGDLSYVKFYASMGTVFTLKNRNTIEPRVVVGFADETLPYAQRFRWGGMDTFYGERYNGIHGRMIVATNMEYRYKLPVKNLFNMYFSIRYDLANAAEKNQEVRFRDFRQAIGGKIALDLPVGPIEIGYGSIIHEGDRIYFSFGHRF